MNKRPLLIVAALTMVAGFFQWRQHRGLAEKETALRTEVAALKATLAQPSRVGAASRSAKAADAASQSTAHFDVAKFIATMEELARHVGSDGRLPRDPAKQAELQKSALPLLAQIAAAPADKLRAAFEAFSKSATISDEAKRELMEPLLIRMAELDPAWAATQAVKGPRSQDNLERIVRAWGAKDAAAVFAWIEEAEKDGTLRAAGITNVANLRARASAGQASADPLGALETLPGLDPESARPAAQAMGAALRTPADRAHGLESIATRTNTATLHQFARSLGAAGFDTAREALESAKLSPAQRETAAVAIATGAVGPQSTQHAAWLMENLATESGEPLRPFIEAWTKADFNAVATWLKTQPPTPRRDTAIAAFTQRIAASEPLSAADWAATIADAQQRSTALAQIWSTWHAQDAAAAEAYFKELGLPAPAPDAAN